MEVADSDQLQFTDDEFYHLRQCSNCFLLWKQLILDAQPPAPQIPLNSP
jgi:hypothetical protein